MIQSKLCIGINNEVEHEECEYFCGNGYKSGTKTGYVGAGFFISTDGYGWGRAMKPSKTILRVSVNDEVFDVWVDHYFKDNWGRLTKKRVNAIKATMPRFSLLEEHVSKKGTRYYVLAEDYCKVWLSLAMHYDSTGENYVDKFNTTMAEMIINNVAKKAI